VLRMLRVEGCVSDHSLCFWIDLHAKGRPLRPQIFTKENTFAKRVARRVLNGSSYCRR